MPVYDFINKETLEVTEVILTISDAEQYLKDNPNMSKYFGNQFLNIGDPVKLGIKKIDNGFRDLLRHIKKNTAGANFNIN